ncbi:hypothetical protein ASPFODRAFT_129486 [Aspergillus luchuensis CBS 106.47]|uniref:TFIIS N-terminal domain-containing protein n=1 Tax=Aspergillus luchuensis (strain CBS 106.47) TaxID=1137211 RepID=A0A1M3TQW6_ASPLC|nr:hypothetical protein ASPFODRAFT_129486 [Aspergillus luchuensis CBS 106.47]
MSMDAKEIELRAKAMTKAASSNEPPSTIIPLLKQLQQGVKATEDLLRSTRVGIAVNKLKQHKSPEVARLASEIVSKWRHEVNKQKAGASPGASQRSSSSPHPKTNGTPSGGATPSDKASKLSVPPDKRTWKADGVDTNQTGNRIRDSCIGLMYDGLCLNSIEPPRTVLSKASAVEAAAFSDLGPETKEQYRTKIRSLYQNLKNKSNPSLRVRVLNGDVTPERFVRMSHDELRSEEQQERDRRIQKENMDKAMVAQAERSISTSLQCGKSGLPDLAPFLGRDFTGQDGVKAYFETMGAALRYEGMRFEDEQDWVIDEEKGCVCVRGWARFIAQETEMGWDEGFVYRLKIVQDGGGSDGEWKVQEYRVWADTGAAYLAITGRLNNLMKGDDGK